MRWLPAFPTRLAFPGAKVRGACTLAVLAALVMPLGPVASAPLGLREGPGEGQGGAGQGAETGVGQGSAPSAASGRMGPTQGSQARDPMETAPHAAILLDGDADLCDDEDGDGVVGMDDGIVNCGTADGSASRPFVIQGWAIESLSAPTVGGPPPVAICAGSAHASLLAICHVSKSIAVRNVTFYQATINYTDATGTYAGTAVEILATDASLEGVRIAAGGKGIVVTGPATVRLRYVGLRPLVEENLPGPVQAADLPLVAIQEAEVDLDRVTLEATGRKTALVAQASTAGPTDRPHRLSLTSSRVANATEDGVWTRGIGLEIRGSVFERNGLHGVSRTLSDPAAGQTSTQVMGGAVSMAEGTLLAEGNRFTLRGYGIHAYEATGMVRLNHFASSVEANGSSFPDLALVSADTSCGVRLIYNDLDGVGVSNLEPGCTLDARHNWWGAAQGPSPTQGALAAGPFSLNGPLRVDPHLLEPLDRLPQATIAAPGPGAAVPQGLVAVRGSAVSRDGTALARVEASRVEDDWEGTQEAQGKEAWTLELDLSQTLEGPLQLWVRACSEAACGVPAFLPLNVTPLRPPIALLTARPDVVAPGSTVTLDANASYAPAGGRLALYRFDFGDGRGTGWQAEPTAQATYAKAGRYVAMVEVQDAGGQANINLGQAVVHVVDDASDPQGTPGPAASVAVPVLALAALAAMRRRRP